MEIGKHFVDVYKMVGKAVGILWPIFVIMGIALDAQVLQENTLSQARTPCAPVPQSTPIKPADVEKLRLPTPTSSLYGTPTLPFSRKP